MPYVAIHCPLTLKNKFIEGPVSKLHTKFSELYEHLPYESAGFFQSIELGVQRAWKEAGFHLKLS